MAQSLTTEIMLDPLASTTVFGEHDQGESTARDQLPDTRNIEAPLSISRAVTLIGILTGVTINGSFSTGLLTVGLPSMAPDLHMPENLLLW